MGEVYENAPSFASESNAITINLTTGACLVASSLDRGFGEYERLITLVALNRHRPLPRFNATFPPDNMGKT